MPLFSRLKNRGAQQASKNKTQTDLTNGTPAEPKKRGWQTTWNSKTLEPDEVEELVHMCTAEMRSRAEALDTPFLLLPFRPNSDASSARTFIRNFYKSNAEGSQQYRGPSLQQELRLTEPSVLCSIMKWCWSRMPGGVVSWPVYEGFQIGEKESNMARNAFNTFIPIGVDAPARKNIIYDFFDLLAAVAAHGKMNGLGGRKLSRLAGWWAFDHSDDGKGFEGGYKSWTTAADASSHLFFAYLRSLSPEADPAMSVIERIPRSLQALLASTEYPPETPTLMQRTTPRVVMFVDSVSPTPFALLRRAKHFEYRDNDRVLREYAEFEDPLDALTDECKRVLLAVSATNSSAALSRHGNLSKPQETWNAFQSMGFTDWDDKNMQKQPNGVGGSGKPMQQGLRSEPRSRAGDMGRPTTPSWADFLSSGFNDDVTRPPTFRLPPDKVLPPINSRAPTPSHQLSMIGDENLAPGELAAITSVELDDAFWWVWMTSLAGDEPAERKAVFGRCALVETSIMNGRWLIMEEQVKGASPDPAEGAYIAPKKSIFSFAKRGRNKKTKTEKSAPTPSDQLERVVSATPSKSSLAPDQQSKIKQAAAALARKGRENDVDSIQRRGRHDETASTKTSSMLTMGMMTDASPAMKWASAYDKQELRAKYLGDSFAGTGISREDLNRQVSSINVNNEVSSAFKPPELSPDATSFPIGDQTQRDLPALPRGEQAGIVPAEPEAQPVKEHAHPTNQVTAAAPAPTPMPPKAPEVNVLPANAEERQEEARQVPLPTVSAEEPSLDGLDKEVGVDSSSSPRSSNRLSRKPVPAATQAQDHPAFRQRSDDEPALQATKSNSKVAPPIAPHVPKVAAEPQAPQTPQSPTSPAAIAAARAMGMKQASTSPESEKSDGRQKLKKQGGGGLKKLFGRNKDAKARGSIEAVPPKSNSLAPPSDTNIGRRLSLIRKKHPKTAEIPDEAPAALAVEETAPPDVMQEPAMPSSLPAHHEGPDVDGEVSQEDADPQHEFSRFDQGPMEDMPAAPPQKMNDGPEHEEEHLPAPAPQRHFNTQLAGRIVPLENGGESEEFATPMEHGVDPVDETPAEVEDAEEEQSEHRMPEKDRWAQIRENAARRAARASEERSNQSHQSRAAESMRETDDGETSGEETIESRVARIKARVAELTGNMDGSGARQ